MKRIRDSKFDLQALRSSCDAARLRIEDLKPWEKAAVKLVSYAAASDESRVVLYQNSEDV